MRLTLKCSKCRKELEIKTISSTVLDNIEIEVFPCKNTNCYDCSECEDLNLIEKRAEDAEKKLEEVQKILNKNNT